VQWTPRRGGVLEEVGLAALSGAVGLSQPWLVGLAGAGGGDGKANAVIVLFDGGEVGWISASDKPAVIRRGWKFVTPAAVKPGQPTAKLKLRSGHLPLQGEVEIAFPLAQRNIANARQLCDRLAAFRDDFERNDREHWRWPARLALFLLPTGWGIVPAIIALRRLRRSADRKGAALAWIALAANVIVIAAIVIANTVFASRGGRTN
jgi:hypothetical protein